MSDIIDSEKKMTPNEINRYCVYLHMSSFLAYFIPVAGLVAPFVLWQLKKEDDRIDMHGKEVMNYSFTFIIYWAIAFVGSIFLIGIPFMILLGAYSVAIPIIATIKAGEGKFYKYPFIIRFL